MKKLLKPIIIISASTIILVSVLFLIYKIRMNNCIEKQAIEMRESGLNEEIITNIGNKLDSELMTLEELVSAVSGSRLLLFGEPHLKIEVMDYFTQILDRLHDEKMILAVELPPSVQNYLDAFVAHGEERFLDSLAMCKYCLPLPNILKWCHENKDRVSLVAVDEEREVSFKRRKKFCMDTRNQTMFRNIFKIYKKNIDARIVFYGGQLHAMKSGRYKYDVSNRTSTGSRLINSNIPDEDVKVIMISGNDDFPLAPAWKGRRGALDGNGEFFNLPVTYFYTYPLYRLEYAGEIFDYFVNVGETTMVDLN